MNLRTLAGVALCALATALVSAGCAGKNYLKPVVAGTGAWEKEVRLEVLRARFNIKSPDKFFRDDGLFEGNLDIHTQELQVDLKPGSVTTTGKAAEGLIARGTRQDGKDCIVIYGAAAGEDPLNRARHEALRAAAVIKLGMREGLEQYFRANKVSVQFKTVSDRALEKLVEAYALAQLDYPFDRIGDPELREMAQLLLERGIGRTGRRPIGTRHWSSKW